MSISFKAAILAESKKDLLIDYIETTEELRPGQVLIKIIFSGICGAQVNEIDAVKGPDRFLPHLLGHEGFGEVVKVGDLVSTVAPGDKVVLHWMVGDGIQSQTPKYLNSKLGVINAGWVTTFSEFTIVSENRCTKVNSNITEHYLPLLGCAATTAIGVINNDAKVKIGDSVVVIGVGGVGLLTVAAAKLAGAHPIICIDISNEKLEESKSFGATLGINALESNIEFIKTKIIEYLDGSLPDVTIDTTGNREMIGLSIELAKNSGKSVLVGVPRFDESVAIDTLPFHFGTTVTGSKGGQTIPQRDIPRLIKLIESEKFPLTKVPIEKIRLDEINEALKSLRNGFNGRFIIDFT